MSRPTANIPRINATSRHSWSSYTARHTDHQWSAEDKSKLSEMRPQASCFQCSLACMQSEQGLVRACSVNEQSNRLWPSAGAAGAAAPALFVWQESPVPELEPISARLTTRRDRTWLLQNMRGFCLSGGFRWAKRICIYGHKRYAWHVILSLAKHTNADWGIFQNNKMATQDSLLVLRVVFIKGKVHRKKKKKNLQMLVLPLHLPTSSKN